jgi:phage tail sheath gpL-like
MDIAIVGSTTAGVSFVITQMAGGATDPDVQPALDQVGGVWETMFVSCFSTTNSAALNAYEAWNEGRWQPLTRKPAIFFTGTTEASPQDAIVIPEGRKTDRSNSQLPEPGGKDLDFVVAAGQVVEIANLANTTPAHNYGSQVAAGLTPGPDEDQWHEWEDRQLAVLGGSSTVEVRNGQVLIGDVVTFYHPDCDPQPAYRKVVRIVKLQNILYSIDLEFAQPKWDGAPLVPDSQQATEPTAKKPRDAVAAAAQIVGNLGLRAILSDPDTTKQQIVAEIDSADPDRLNLCIPVNVSGNTDIKSIDLKWSLFFGSST